MTRVRTLIVGSTILSLACVLPPIDVGETLGSSTSQTSGTQGMTSTTGDTGPFKPDLPGADTGTKLDVADGGEGSIKLDAALGDDDPKLDIASPNDVPFDFPKFDIGSNDVPFDDGGGIKLDLGANTDDGGIKLDVGM